MEKTGRNEACKCGSETKYKKCCLRADEKAERISVFSKFAAIADPRGKQGRRYMIIDLLIMVIYGILNRHTDFVGIADFLKVNEAYFKGLLLIDRTPSHDWRKVKKWMRANMHTPVKELIAKLNVRLRGHYNYYGLSHNWGKLRAFFEYVQYTLYKTLRRRSQKKEMNWERFNKVLKFEPLLRPTITVPLW